MADEKTSQLTPGAPRQGGDLVKVARGLGDNNLALRDLAPTGQNLVVVDPSGQGHYTSVKAAVDAANGAATESNRVTVVIMPGIYAEDQIVVKSFVTLRGWSDSSCIIRPNTDTAAAIIATGSAQIRDLRVEDADGVGGIGVSVSTNAGEFTSVAVFLSGVTCVDCETGFDFDGTGATTGLQVTAIQCVGLQTFGAAAGLVDDAFFVHDGAMASLDLCRGIATNPANKLEHGIHADGAGTSVIAKACALRSCVVGIYATDTARIGGSSTDTQFCTTAFESATGATLSMGSSVAIAADMDARVSGATSTLILSACLLDDRKLDLDADATTIISHTSSVPGDRGFAVKGEFLVGSPEQPKETVLGEGDSYTRGMKVYTFDGVSTYTDVTEAAASDSESVLEFPTGAVGECIYITSQLSDSVGLKQFLGIKTLVDTAWDGTGAIVAEYWNGSAWVGFNLMETDSDAPYNRRGPSPSLETGSYQLRFDPRMLADWAVNNPPSDAFGNSYWARYRITSVVTTPPAYQQLKVHSNRSEINGDGFREYFGKARPTGVIEFDLSSLASAGGGPSDAGGQIAAGLTVIRQENSLAVGESLPSAFVKALPADLDTSSPLRLVISGFANGAVAAPANVRLEVEYAISKDGTALNSAGAGYPATTKTAEVEVPISATDDYLQVTGAVLLDVAELTPNGVSYLWVRIGRVASTGTELGVDFAPIQSEAFYLKWSDGAHYSVVTE